MFQEKYFDSLTNCILHFSFLLLRKYPRHPRHPRHDCSLPIVYIYTIDTVVATLDTFNSYCIPPPHRDVRKTCTCALLEDKKYGISKLFWKPKEGARMQLQVPVQLTTSRSRYLGTSTGTAVLLATRAFYSCTTCSRSRYKYRYCTTSSASIPQ